MAAQLVTVDMLKKRYETDVSEDILQLVIDAEEADVIRRFGPHNSAIERFVGDGRSTIILNRPAQSITSVVEDIPVNNSMQTVTLESNDYHLIRSMVLERLDTGDNPSYILHSMTIPPMFVSTTPKWRGTVTVTFNPIDMNAARAKVIMELCIVHLQFDGHTRTRYGDYESWSPADYNRFRENVMRQLKHQREWFA